MSDDAALEKSEAAQSEKVGTAEAELPGLVVRGLAELPPGTALDAKALAGILGTCKKTVLRMAARGEMPAPFRMNGRFFWLAGAVLGHFEERQQKALDTAKRRALKILGKSP